MRIPRSDSDSSLEINLIPLIDILLVIVIFLVVNTTFVRQSQLKVDLPGTQAAEKKTQDAVLTITVGRDGNYSIGNELLIGEQQLRRAIALTIASLPDQPKDELRAVIQADAAATHQSVVSVMDILAASGVVRVSIATAGGQ